MQPDTAMIFAAGFGTRMRHLTKNTPKPLVPVNGTPMIDHSLDILSDAAIRSVIVNTHYFADQLETYLAAYPFVTCIRETPDVLETGGGLKNALPQLGVRPVFTLNCDAVWLDENPVAMLKKHWKPDEMDGLLLLVKQPDALGYNGQGDFFLDAKNRLQRKGAKPSAPYVYTGVQIIKTERLAEISEACFSISALWGKMIMASRLCGVVYNGAWADVGHPEGIKAAEQKPANV